MQNPNPDPSPPKSPLLSIPTVPPPSPITSQELNRLSLGVPKLNLCTALIDTGFEAEWSDLPPPEDELEPTHKILFHEDQVEPTRSEILDLEDESVFRPSLPPRSLEQDTDSFVSDAPRELSLAVESPPPSTSSPSFTAPSSPSTDEECPPAHLQPKSNQVSGNPTRESSSQPHPAASSPPEAAVLHPDREPACKASQDETHTWLSEQQTSCSGCGRDLKPRVQKI